MKDNRSIVEKADIAVSNLITSGGYLNAEQSDKFIQMVIDQPTLINQARVVRMNAPKRKIEKIGFGNRILRAAPTSGTALDATKRARPDLGMIELETEEIIAEVWLPYDVLEDNIERGGLESTIMSMIAERAALDLEELMVLGDTSSSDDYLALMDGILNLTPTGHVINASAETDVTKALFKKAIQRMPTRYLRNRAMMKFYCSHHVEMEYRDSIADRATTLGDEKVSKFTPMFAYGTPVQPAAMMPDDKLWLSYPKNIVWGVQRDIMVETDKDIRRRVLIIVLTMRTDIKIEEPQACVTVEGFTDSGLPSTTTTTT